MILQDSFSAPCWSSAGRMTTFLSDKKCQIFPLSQNWATEKKKSLLSAYHTSRCFEGISRTVRIKISCTFFFFVIILLPNPNNCFARFTFIQNSMFLFFSVMVEDVQGQREGGGCDMQPACMQVSSWTMDTDVIYVCFSSTQTPRHSTIHPLIRVVCRVLEEIPF